MIKKIGTHDNPADVLTKYVQENTLSKNLTYLGLAKFNGCSEDLSCLSENQTYTKGNITIPKNTFRKFMIVSLVGSASAVEKSGVAEANEDMNYLFLALHIMVIFMLGVLTGVCITRWWFQKFGSSRTVKSLKSVNTTSLTEPLAGSLIDKEFDTTLWVAPRSGSCFHRVSSCRGLTNGGSLRKLRPCVLCVGRSFQSCESFNDGAVRTRNDTEHQSPGE